METEYRKHWMHRGYGLVALALGGFFVKSGFDVNITSLTIGGALIAVEGSGDLITGYHHYLSQKAIDGIKYARNRLN